MEPKLPWPSTSMYRMLDKPEATLPDLMEHIKGPDFPTRAIIMGRSGIRAAYATGRGRVAIRAGACR